MILAAAAVSACQEQDSEPSQAKENRFYRLSASASGRGGTAGPSETVDWVKPAALGYAPADAEGLAQATRAVFDGDTRSLGRASAVPVSSADWGGRRAPIKLTVAPQQGPGGRSDDVPPPDSLPDVDLPDPQPGVGPKGGGPTLLGFDAFQRAMNDFMAPLLSRVGWGAAKRRGQPTPHAPYRVTVHHTQSARVTMSEPATIQQVRNVQRYHMVGRRREGKDAWDDIGYHFLIDGEGRIVEGRPAEVMGAHAGGSNDGNIGVALIGDFNKTKPTDAQVRSLERLVVYLAIKYRRDPSHKGFLQPHQHFNSTDCPGANLVAILDRIRLDVDRQADEAIARLGGSGQSAAFQPMLLARD